MQLNNFQAVAKKRSGWEAIDLGCTMARAWFFKLWLVWLIPAGMCLLIFSFIFRNEPSYASLITWLLKPVWERPLLYIASQQLFGERVSFRNVIRNFIKCNTKDWFWWLTLRRLLPSRGFTMPVTVLEGLTGRNRSDRINLLQRRFSSPANWLLISAVHIELFIVFAIGAAVAMLMPAGVELHWQSIFFEHVNVSTHLYNLAWLLSASLIAPFFVCAGFSLYLQRRIDLEGWDIEIHFRQLAARLEKQKLRLTSSENNSFFPLSGLVIATCFAVGLSISAPESIAEDGYVKVKDANFELASEAQTTRAENTDETEYVYSQRVEAKRLAHDILSKEPFYYTKTEETLALKPKEETAIPEWLIRFAEWLSKMGGFFSFMADIISHLALIVEVFLWIGLALIIALILWRYREWIRRSLDYFKETDIEQEPVVPKELFGIVLEDEPLPEDVAAEALAYWSRNEHRAAFALLLRATILQCAECGCQFKDGYTEFECSSVVKSMLEEKRSTSFSQLISHWQQLAYAHRKCSDDVFTQLCDAYREYWQSE